MALESASHISDLDQSNPVTGDVVSQGDDHLRLLKAVLKTTFPNGAKAFRFPATAAVAAGTVTVTFPDDQNKLFPVNATAAARTVNLPDPTSGSTVNEDGFSVWVVKTDASANAVTIDGSGSQTINGATTYVLTRQWQLVKLTWSGDDNTWYATTDPGAASATLAGLVELLTDAEFAAGTDTSRYMNAYQFNLPEVDVASGTTTDLPGAASNFVRITGTTTITGFGTAAAGLWRMGRFAAALTLTHNATSLILPGGANITTAANDRFLARSLGNGNWLVLFYQKASGRAIIETQQVVRADMEAQTDQDTYIPPDLLKYSPLVAKGYGNIASDGTLSNNKGCVTTATKTATGTYEITIDAFASSSVITAIVCLTGSSAQNRMIQVTYTSATKLTVTTHTSAAAIDFAFSVIVFGTLAA